ncbi:MAG: hypothetical protein WBQ08_10800, partial [Candidatus Sulfotelmatobacter sp.]
METETELTRHRLSGFGQPALPKPEARSRKGESSSKPEARSSKLEAVVLPAVGMTVAPVPVDGLLLAVQLNEGTSLV